MKFSTSFTLAAMTLMSTCTDARIGDGQRELKKKCGPNPACLTGETCQKTGKGYLCIDFDVSKKCDPNLGGQCFSLGKDYTCKNSRVRGERPDYRCVEPAPVPAPTPAPAPAPAPKCGLNPACPTGEVCKYNKAIDGYLCEELEAPKCGLNPACPTGEVCNKTSVGYLCQEPDAPKCGLNPACPTGKVCKKTSVGYLCHDSKKCDSNIGGQCFSEGKDYTCENNRCVPGK